MVAGALQELLTLVDWGGLDLLLLDLPPGTGDVLLGLGQSVPVSGVVTVTTPQEVSLLDTRRGIRGFEQLQVPHLGMVENLSGFVCDACGDIAPLFGEGTVERVAEELALPFLGRVPIDPTIRAGADAGRPAPIVAGPESAAVRAYDSIARAVLAQLSHRGRAGGTFDVTWQTMAADEIRRDPPIAPAAEHAEADRPVAVWQASRDRLGIRWGDGKTSFHEAYALRRACPCAGCLDEWTREELPSLERVPRDVVPRTVRSVGRYALQPVWSDGHRSGIYSFRDLRGGLAAVES
jgi:ATP-binding protein involved in chromosome partitioning